MAKLELLRILSKRKKIIQLHSMIHYDFYMCISRTGFEKKLIKIINIVVDKSWTGEFALFD